MRLWMKDHSKDEDVKGYRKTIGRTNEAEANLKRRAKELARNALGSFGDTPISKLEIESLKQNEKKKSKNGKGTDKKKNQTQDQEKKTKKYIYTAHKRLSQILEDMAKFRV